MINSLQIDSHIIHQKRLKSPLQKNSADKREIKCAVPGLNVNNNARKNENMTRPESVNFCGFFNTEKFLKSNGLKKTLNFVKDQQLVFGATYALFLTCVLRPLSILVSPSKKNKDDQKFASAHSIASGLIGFGISTVIFTPISHGIKKFADNYKNYLKADSYLLKDAEALKSAKFYLDRLPDLITAVPKGILTIALIPPILKYVFGIEKSKKGAPAAPPLDYSLINFKSTDKDEKFATFMGGMK